MEQILSTLNTPDDLKKLSQKEKIELSNELRERILEIVSKTGGHLASNLGIVELTIALHSIFDMPKDKIIWDVGHQTYVHKILTGRNSKMETLRQKDGISGFPKTTESEYDSFDTGHSSTSISVALGMARARDILRENSNIIAVIGDGALTGGMAQEALNDAGCSHTNLIVVLNDNEMSISKNVGGIPILLSKMRTKRFYTNSNKHIKRITRRIPYIGDKIIKGVRRIKHGIKQLIIPNMYFEDIGFTYLGPVDGHNIDKLESLLAKAKELTGPVLVHVITKKGKGYKPAEINPDKFHGTSSFNIETGEKISPSKKDYSKVFGEKLVELASKDNRIVSVTAAMKDGTGLRKFEETFPNRIFDVGIAEQHALGLVAGMAKMGLKPVIPLYSSFLQRGYDQLIHDICMQSLPVVIGIDRAGIVGNDGETHQGIYDLSFLSTIPNICIMAPKDFNELEDMLEFALNENRPICIRYPRGGEEAYNISTNCKVEMGKAEVISSGSDATIIAIGKMVNRAIQIARELEKENKSIEVINVRFLKPIDENTILKSIKKTKCVITIEDNIEFGGLGTSICEIVVKNNLQGVKLKKIAYPVEYVKQASVNEIEKEFGMDKENIKNIVKDLMANE